MNECVKVFVSERVKPRQRRNGTVMSEQRHQEDNSRHAFNMFQLPLCHVHLPEREKKGALTNIKIMTEVQ